MPNKTLPLTLLILALALAYSTGELRGQPVNTTPDCVVAISLTAAASTPGGNGFDNRTLACTTWVLAYQSSGFSGLTLTFQSSLGSVTPTSYGNYTGTVITGAIVSTSTTGAQSTFSNGVVVTPWVRVTLSGLTGSGTVNGVLYGWRAGDSGGSTGSGSPTVTQLAACQVAGGISGQTNTAPVTAAISLSASGLTQIVAASGSTVITVCHIDMAGNLATNMQLEYGTGANCGTGTTAITGTYQNVVTYAEDVPFNVPSGKALCVNLGASNTFGGLIIYVQQ